MINERLEKLRAYLKEKDIQAVLISKKENCFYFSNFTGSSSFLIITESKSYLLTDFRYVAQAKNQASEFEIIKYTGNFEEFLCQFLKDQKIDYLAFEEGHITVEKIIEYEKKLNLLQLIPLGGISETLRAIKDENEIELIKKAVEVSDNAFLHVLSYIKPGVTEFEIAAEIEYFMKKAGASSPSFETIVASGHRAALPHGVASHKKLKLGDVITLDYGAKVNEYCSDITRTVFLGKPKKRLKDIYNIVSEAQILGIKAACISLLGKEVDYIAREHINKKNFEKNFGHGLGHGVGIEVHENPRLSPFGEVKLENGMVVTVEPGIYIEKLGGVRIEDIIVINNNEPIILTKATKEMIVL